MRALLSVIKNILAVIAIVVIAYFALKHAPFLKDKAWNPVNTDHAVNMNGPEAQFVDGQRYRTTDNTILKNMPASQTGNIFQWIDKREFMAVSGLSRLGYNNHYLVGQRGDMFIMYHFGDETMRIYATEIELNRDLYDLGQNIKMKPAEAFE